ncbi:RNA polymerase subunit sigma-70 [Acidithiobacillus thiooxidans]|jgi:RNA polymerase sigma-70 factor (ECF subfamily)|uniref:RNA polymerase sigma factor n=2 Tax=Acidithiobacillus thiooxidans TaxID=930 RepID=A0A1C2IN71_ACITH|nr:RNA polymerase subunit sigma-70 [Acidithiobacillus thiooxidans]OCX77441.1 RNA polymerase subunit sigma-70 [Acidithiobacillus thiooxidans]OCX85218.1 RNA polymerase subunit sigma-70 [Acidithiobacillus thiooxidans]OCX88784.1 RNA polymerase subunit sigma-70 [Acidithiobacillus thiooxidans]
MTANLGDTKHQMPPDPNDQVHACQPEHWLDRYGDGLYRQALFRTSNMAVAEDIVQETLLAAWLGYAGFSGAAQERTWLYGIMEHKIQDYYRLNARTPKISNLEVDDLDSDIEESAFQSNGAWANKPGAWGRDPQEAAESKDFLRIIQGCLNELPEQQRSAFMLREWYGEEIALCARTLAVTANHLSVLLHRARLQISRCLEFRFAGGEQQ